jgi:AraC-like DNA-binding protein
MARAGEWSGPRYASSRTPGAEPATTLQLMSEGPISVRVIPSRGEQRTAASSAVVVALVRERATLARLIAAFRPTALRQVLTVEELSVATRELAMRVVAVVAEARDIQNRPTAPVLATLMKRFPTVPVLGYCGIGVSQADELRELARAGVHELVFRDIDDAPTLLRTKLGRGIEACAGAQVLCRMSAQLPDALHALVTYCVSFPRESHEIERVALALGVHRKTLVNWCQRAHVPPPSVLVTWVRLLLAVELLQSPGHTIERVAHSLEFSSGSAFRNLCRRYFGARPAELRTSEGREAAYRAFAWSLDRQRPAPALQRAASRPVSVAVSAEAPASR